MKLVKITLCDLSSIDICCTSTTYLEGFYSPVLIDQNGDIGFFIGIVGVYAFSLL